MAGGVILLAGSLLTLLFDLDTSMTECFVVFLIVGVGMGFVSLSTLILVQNSASSEDLGIVTSLNQFSRTLGGTIGVGICGGLVTNGLLGRLEKTAEMLPQELMTQLRESTENLLLPEFQSLVPVEALVVLRSSVLAGISSVFYVAVAASLLCFFCALCLPGKIWQK